MQFRNTNVEKSGAKDPIMPLPQPATQPILERQDTVAPAAQRRDEAPVPAAPSDLA